MGGAAGRGSMTIGRAVALCLRNIGGQRAGETTKSVFGQPARFGFCIGEWEERSPWPTLSARRGFRPGQDVVTVHGGKGTFPLADIHNDDPRDLLYLIAKSLAFPLANLYLGNPENGEVIVAFNPMWAERFGRRLPRRRRPPAVPARPRLPADRAVAGGQRGDARASRAGSTPTATCTSSSVPTRSCRSCAAAWAASTRSRCPSFGESQMQSKAILGRS